MNAEREDRKNRLGEKGGALSYVEIDEKMSYGLELRKISEL